MQTMNYQKLKWEWNHGFGGDVESFLTQPVASIDVMNSFSIKISCANQ